MDWEIQNIGQIKSHEFYNLVQSNLAHIEKTFPKTVAACASAQETASFLASNIEKEYRNEGHYFYVRHCTTHNLIAYGCVKNINPDILKCELAYFVDKDFEGRGIISELVRHMLGFCFSTLLMNKIFISTSLENAASQRVATKHGFIREGILREEFRNGNGILEDIMYFGLLRTDYERL